MARYYVVAIRDSVVDAFMAPQLCRSAAEAIRGFTDAVNDKSSSFYKHPADFALFRLGTWDDSTAKYDCDVQPVRLVLGSEVLMLEGSIDNSVFSKAM